MRAWQWVSEWSGSSLLTACNCSRLCNSTVKCIPRWMKAVIRHGCQCGESPWQWWMHIWWQRARAWLTTLSLGCCSSPEPKKNIHIKTQWNQVTFIRWTIQLQTDFNDTGCLYQTCFRISFSFHLSAALCFGWLVIIWAGWFPLIKVSLSKSFKQCCLGL